LSDAIKFSVCLSLLFLCGYPSFFIYFNYILVISFLAWLIYQVRSNHRNFAVKTLGRLGIAYLLFFLMCSPAIVSYYEFLPYYTRGSGVSYQSASINPLVPFSVITYLLPNVASKASFLPTDLSMRNASIGLFMFLFFISSLKKINSFKVLILSFTLFSLLYSFGDWLPVQRFCYRFFPLMNTFRHPGTIRVFTSIGLILLAVHSIDAFFRKEGVKEIRRLCYIALLLLFLSGIYFAINSGGSADVHFGFDPAAVKQFLYHLSFQKFALFICILQILFIIGFLFLQRTHKFSKKIFLLLFLSNSIVFAWIGLPFTVVSQYKTSEVNNYIHSFPDGYPLPDINAPVETAAFSDSTKVSLHGYPNFYNKKITIQDYIITPTLNEDYYRFIDNHALRLQLKDYPFVYITNDSGIKQAGTIRLVRFTPNAFSFRINSPVSGNLNLFQQYNHNWQVKVNGQPVSVHRSNMAFMRVNVPAGVSSIEWEYRPQKVYLSMILSALSIVTLVFYFLIKRKQRAYEYIKK